MGASQPPTDRSPQRDRWMGPGAVIYHAGGTVVRCTAEQVRPPPRSESFRRRAARELRLR
eukprot:7505215-Pyramimonas_sp.AAC.1